MKQLCWIVPSRDRVKDLEKFIKSFVDNNDASDLFIILDADDSKSLHYYNEERREEYGEKRVFFIINSINFHGAFLHILNHYSKIMVEKYEYIGFLEDDCVILTKHFDSIIGQCNENVIYLNDKETQPDHYAGVPIIKSSVIKKLGFYSPPELKCLWADKYWKDLGDLTGSIKFLPNVFIRHEHYSFSNNSKQQDEVGKRIENIGHEDYIIWTYYEKSFHENIVNKLVNN